MGKGNDLSEFDHDPIFAIAKFYGPFSEAAKFLGLPRNSIEKVYQQYANYGGTDMD